MDDGVYINGAPEILGFFKEKQKRNVKYYIKLIINFEEGNF